MKYPIDKELKSISIYSGSVVGWMYPMINIGYRLRKCRSDKCISVRRVSTPGYDGEKINTLIIEPKECGIISRERRINTFVPAHVNLHKHTPLQA